VVSTVGVVVLLLVLLPHRIRLIPVGVPFALCGALFVTMAAVAVSPRKTPWLRVERIILLLFLAVTMVGTPVHLVHLIQTMVRRSGEITGLELFASSVAIWLTNILSFSLVYWRIDRGGPEARANGWGVRRDWQFPRESLDEGGESAWRPTFVDYLFLGYSTATAFSATDATPLTSRAKILMMIESTIALATLAVVAARAINILGS
jgi:hypothetical protein